MQISDCCLVSRMEQADLTLVVVDSALLPCDAEQGAAFLQGHLRSVLSNQEQPETGTWYLDFFTFHKTFRATSNLLLTYILLYTLNSLFILALPADKCLLVLNKSDLLPEDGRQKLTGELRRVSGLPPICLISCHSNEGLQDFLTVLHSRVKTLWVIIVFCCTRA